MIGVRTAPQFARLSSESTHLPLARGYPFRRQLRLPAVVSRRRDPFEIINPERHGHTQGPLVIWKSKIGRKITVEDAVSEGDKVAVRVTHQCRKISNLRSSIKAASFAGYRRYRANFTRGWLVGALSPHYSARAGECGLTD